MSKLDTIASENTRLLLAAFDFERAANLLVKLAGRGFTIYLANDTLNLMEGESHDEKGKPRQHAVIISRSIPGAGGGDW